MNNRIISSIVIILLLLSSSYAQNVEKVAEIEAYKNKLEEFVNSTEKREALTKDKSESIQEITKMYFKAKTKDAYRLKLELVQEHELKTKAVKQQGLTQDQLRSFRTKKMIQNDIYWQLRENMDKNELKLYSSDYIVIGTIVNKEVLDLIDEELNGYKYKATILTLNIQDIIVGDTLVNINDNIQFLFGNAWSKKPAEFVVGNEYFLNLEYRLGDSPLNCHLYLISYADDNNGSYPIINNEIIDKSNTYQLGGKIKISDIKKYYKELIRKVYGVENE